MFNNILEGKKTAVNSHMLMASFRNYKQFLGNMLMAESELSLGVQAAEVIFGFCSSDSLQDEQLYRILHEEINHLALKLERQGKTEGKNISSRRKHINKM